MVTKACETYFSGFFEIANYEKNNTKTNCIAAAKIAANLIFYNISALFALVYCAVALYDRVFKKGELSETELKVNEAAMRELDKLYAEKILKEVKCNESVKTKIKQIIESEAFLANPQKELVNLMVQYKDKKDHELVTVLATILPYADKFTKWDKNVDYLDLPMIRQVAQERFVNDPSHDIMMEVIEGALANPEFKTHLEKYKTYLNTRLAEKKDHEIGTFFIVSFLSGLFDSAKQKTKFVPPKLPDCVK